MWSAATATSPVMFCSSNTIFASLASSLAEIAFIMCWSEATLSVLVLTCLVYEIVGPIYPANPLLCVVLLAKNCCALWSSIFTHAHILSSASRMWKIYLPLSRRFLSSILAMRESHLSSFVVATFPLARAAVATLISLMMVAMCLKLYSMSTRFFLWSSSGNV